MNLGGIYEKLLKDGEITSTLNSKEIEREKVEPVKILKKKKASKFDIEDYKQFFYELSAKARKCGLLALESDAKRIDKVY